MCRTYIDILRGRIPVSPQPFWKHILRYWLVHIVIGLILMIWMGIFVASRVTDAFIQNTYQQTITVADQLFMTGLEITYDPTTWITTNMSWPVVWTMEQVTNALPPSLAWKWNDAFLWPKNVLVIDPTATVEDFPNYDTMMLMTQKYLLAQSSSEMKLIPLVKEGSTGSTAVLINKTLLTQLFDEWSTRIGQHGPDIRRTLFTILLVGGLLAIPLVAFSLVAWLSIGMLLITLVSRWLSKIWVRVSYRHLFTWLSYAYLLVYILLKALVWTNVLPWAWIIGYIAMIGCLAVYIVREDEKSKKKSS